MDIRILFTKEPHQIFNIALEQAILTYSADNDLDSTIRIWRNDKSVVLGRNQNITDEINIDYCRENNIEILRRISGGGAVYHDPGNINFSIFFSPQLRKQFGINIEEITINVTNLLMKSLLKIGYKGLEIEGKSNIFYKGKKISGSAGYMYKNWYLHHATILESVNIDHLNNSLLARESNPIDKKKSRYYETINLQDFNQDLWITNLMKIMELDIPIKFIEGNLFQDEINLANNYVDDLYSKDFWIYKGRRKEK